MNLTKRLRQILDYCPKKERWADIGCDHGRLSCALILADKAAMVFAADISAPSLQKAGELARTIGIADRVQLRLGDGLQSVAEDAPQGAVLSGMGGPLIVEILQAVPCASLETLVLSPQKYPERVRQYLNENAWKIEEECIVAEAGKFYPVFRVTRGTDAPYSAAELLAGRNVRYDADFEAYLRYKVQFWQGVRDGVADAALRNEIDEKLSAYRGKFI